MAQTLDHSSNWPHLLETGLRKIFFDAFRSKPMVFPLLFDVVNMSKKTIEDLGDAGSITPMEEWQGQVKYEGLQQGYSTSITAVGFTRGIKIETQLVRDDQYNVIRRRPQGLGLAARRSMENRAARVFTSGTATTYHTGGDAVALFAHNHPRRDGGAVQANEGVLSLTPANIETTRQAMLAFKDNTGQDIDTNPDTILIPRALQQTAFEILFADGKPQMSGISETHHPNFFSGMYKLVIWDKLTDADAWYMLDSELMKQFLLFGIRDPLEFSQDGEFDTRMAKYAAWWRGEVGFTDWRWGFAQIPA